MSINVDKLLKDYKEYQKFKESDDYDEEYKFDFFKNNQIDFSQSPDFEKDFKEIRKSAFNLIPRNIRDHLLPWISKRNNEAFQKMLTHLYDETIDLAERINVFENQIYEIILNDEGWTQKGFGKLGFGSTSFLLALKDYKKYPFINPVTPFNNFIKEYELDSKKYKKGENGERYVSWVDLIADEIIPVISKIDSEGDLLDIQDFIFCSFGGYEENIEKEFEKWLKNAKDETQFILGVLVELQSDGIDDGEGFISRERLADSFDKIVTGKKQNTSQYFSQNFDTKRTSHIFLQKAVAFLPKGAYGGDVKTHYKVHPEYLEFLHKNLDRLKGLENNNTPNYWLYAPGHNASKWEEFHSNGIMGIAWDELGNLEQYPDSEKIKEKLIETTGKANPYNDVLACEDFVRNIKIGDIVIPKQGTKNYLGYGIVQGDYEFDDNLEEYKSTRKVKWMKKGVWEEIEGPIVLKTLTDITKYTDYVERLKKLLGIHQNENTINTPKMDTTSKLLTSKKQIILYGPPGTGKTYNVKKIILNHSGETDYDTLKDTGRVEFITFHQSFSYEEFIEGIKPVMGGDNGEISYQIEDGIFKRLVDVAMKKELTNFDESYSLLLEKIEETSDGILILNTKTGREFGISINSNGNLNLHTGENKNKQGTLTKNNIRVEAETEGKVFEYWQSYFESVKQYLQNECGYRTIENLTKTRNYYLIIDEINRGNISKIFGELITLLEADKRIGGDNEITTKLPYSKEDFGIPSNLFIVATMNTSDKSIVSLDTALRRRFGFVEMLPDYTLEGLQRDIEGINLSALLEKINDRIEHLIDKDHLIGHSYFLKISHISDLKSTIYNEIVPLLEEYFYGEEEKMRQVLGSRLFAKKNISEDLFEKSVQVDISSDEEQFVINKDISDADFVIALKNIIQAHEEV